MNTEFHYYMTYLIAAKAGFDSNEAETIAYASQYVDDNDMIFEIDKDKSTAYRNYISQTMNILKPKPKLFRIYPVFHFIPGDPQSETAWRKDGKMHWLNTTPNSANAQAIIDAALETEDLHRIGVAVHGFADTWAHQNFVGYFDGFNAMGSLLEKPAPNIGHADAMHNPDLPSLVWKDGRMIEPRIDNKARFLEASAELLAKLFKITVPDITEQASQIKQNELCADLSKAIGERDQGNHYEKERIARYTELGLKPEYGGAAIPEYDADAWFDDAVNEDVRGLRDRSDFTLCRWDCWTDVYSWKSGQDYTSSNWYKFQEAVKSHQADTLSILMQANLKGLELPEL